MSNTILVRRGPEASIPTLNVGEFGFCTDSPYNVYIGTSSGNKIVGATGSFENLTDTAFSSKTDKDLVQWNGSEWVNKSLVNAGVQELLSAVTSDVSINNQKLTSLATPTNATDGANKAYVDSVAAGLTPTKAVRAITTAAGTLASDFEAGDVIDGVTLVAGDRILIKNQVDESENGIYVVNASGAPTRASDFDSDAEVKAGAFIIVEEGTVGDNTAWVLTTNNPITVGTTDLEFAELPIASVTTINDLSDVVIDGTPATGEILGYDGGWKNKTLTEAGIQGSLTFGIADTNAVKIDGTATNGDYVVFTSSGITSVTPATLLASLGTIDGGTWT